MRLPSLYSKTSKGKLNIWTIWTEGASVVTEWGEADGKTQTNRVKVKGKNIGRSNETTPEEQADLEATSKWNKQKRLKYYESPEEAMNTLNLKPMTAYSLDEKRIKKLKWPVTVQPKYDGVRCMAYLLSDGSVRLMSRGGKDYEAPHIKEALKDLLKPGMCLDGELYIHGESLQNIRHLMAEEDSRLCYYMYDIVELPKDDTPWSERQKKLATLLKGNINKTLRLAKSIKAGNMDQVKHYHDTFVETGYEGAIVRTMEGKYKIAGRSKDLLKYKMFQDAEFRVVHAGKGKDEVPLFTCIQEEGLEFDVRPVGTAAERKAMLKNMDQYVGQMLTVKFQDRSDDNIPKFGVGVSFRPAEDMD